MLPAVHRLTDPGGYRSVVRSGRRSGSRTLVVHLHRASVDADGAVSAVPARVGFVVSTAVGNAVVRNRVRRRLRHLMAPRISDLPAGCTVVLRALPAAADGDSAELEADLTRCLERVTGVGPRRGPETKVAS